MADKVSDENFDSQKNGNSVARVSIILAVVVVILAIIMAVMG